MSDLSETLDDLLADLRIAGTANERTVRDGLAGRMAAAGASYVKDLRINLKNCLKSEHLGTRDAALIAYAVAVNNGNGVLEAAFDALAREHGADDQLLAEMASCASLLSVNNVLYRFRHFVGKESYQQMGARIKMSIMMRPVSGKLLFELTSLAISAVNGCEQCVKSHERSVIEAGASEALIFDVIRLAAVVTGTGKVVRP